MSAVDRPPGEGAGRRRGRRAAAWVGGSAAAVVAVMTGFRSPEADSPTPRSFAEQPVPLAVDTPFDLGVADVNDDGALDLFTTNHNSRQSILLGDGQGGFVDQLTALGLDQNAAYPGWESVGSEPERRSRGLYLYWFNNRLVLRSEGTGAPSPEGRLEIISPVRIFEQDGFSVSVHEAEEGGWPTTTLDFTAQRDAVLVLQPEFLGVPITLSLAEGFPLEQVFIGSEQQRPTSLTVDLMLDDRHGMAWADFDGDGLTDLFITRGGLRGEIASFPRPLQDELYDGTGGRFVEVTATSGIEKGGCQGRGTAWLDENRDGRLDLFVACVGGSNQLWRQGEQGRFEDVAGDVGLAAPEMSSFAWTDIDRDGDLELVAGQRGTLMLYTKTGAVFEPVALAELRGEVTQVLVGDHESDGDIDVFAVSSEGNVLVVNNDGKLEPARPERLGLPETSLAAAWVDFDNDGLLDLHSIPGGIYRQRAGRFEATGLLAGEVPQSLSQAWVAWPDVNGDGARDPVMLFLGEARREPGSASLHHNLSRGNHWLQVELVGPAGNRQAIGAVVEVTTPDGTQVLPVGASETSRYSQGHYRLYAGLGRHSRAESVSVTWPDGSHEVVEAPPANEILRLDAGT